MATRPANVAALVSQLRAMARWVPGVICGGRHSYHLRGWISRNAARLTSRAEREPELTPALASAAAEHAFGLLSAGILPGRLTRRGGDPCLSIRR
jgi:hypothetical protein